MVEALPRTCMDYSTFGGDILRSLQMGGEANGTFCRIYLRRIVVAMCHKLDQWSPAHVRVLTRSWAIADKPRVAGCKVVEVLQNFLSEYVDKKFTTDYNVILYLSIFNSFRLIRCLSQCVSPKISIFTTFLFPLGTPLWQSRKTLHEWKDNSVLAKQLAACTHLSSTVLSYSNRKCKKLPFSRTADHNFVSPGDAPATITQCVTWMERQFNACQITRSMYLSIFNSFWVIRCLSQCVSPKIAIFPHFCFPWGHPGAITLNVVWMKENSMLTNCLAACTHLS